MQTALLIIVFVAVDMMIIGGLFWALAMEWNHLARTFPACEPDPEAIRRNHQSCSLGIFNLGWCTHISTDDDYLHIHPALFLRLCTHRSVSIPWSEIVPGKRRAFGRFRKFRIGNQTMVAPSWAVDLAEPEPDDQT